MIALNNLPISWDSFIQGMCARRKMISFSRLWEECTQEEAWLITREENMGATENQAPRIHTRRNYRNKGTTITTRGRIIIIKDKIISKEILPIIDATLVMRRDTTSYIFLETKTPSTRSPTRKDIMLTPLKMMN